MCLRLLRNWAKLKLPSKRKQAKERATNGLANGDIHKKSLVVEIYPIVGDTFPFVDEDIEPELFDRAPEVIDPSKAYFSALPLELKLEILDHFHEGYSIPMGKKSWEAAGRWISPSKANIKTLKSIRRCNRELALLGLRYLFAVVNLSPFRRSRPNWLLNFEQKMLPAVGPWIRYASVYLDDENEAVTARVLKQIPNLQWLVFDCRLQNYSPSAVDVLSALSHITRLSLYSCSPQLMSNLAANIKLVEKYGSTIRTLDIFCDWSSAPPDQLFHAIRDNILSLETLYVFSTRESLLANILVNSPIWGSRQTLKDVHFEECTEMDAWIVADMVRLCPNLMDVNISSCGGPGDYSHAQGRDEERLRIVKQTRPIERPPLNTLRIVHATDVEFRHMCRIPTRKLIVYDPLDQLLLGELLERIEYFPGLGELELQYVREVPVEGAEVALVRIREAVAKRGACIFSDTQRFHEPPRMFFW